MKKPQILLFAICLIVLTATTLQSQKKPKYGAIEVTAQQEDALVYIEGFLAGTVPITVDQILPGPYRVVVKKDSFDDFVQDIIVERGEIAKVEAALTTGQGGNSTVRDEDDWTPLQDKDKKKYEKAKSTTKLRQYKVLEIGNFLTKSDEVVPPDHLYALLRGLASRLEKKTKFEQFVTNYTQGPSDRWSEPSTSTNDVPTLVLTGVITRYQRGSRAKRYMIGFGAGKTRMYCLFRFVDKATNEVILERMENGSISGGLSFAGGASDKAVKELADDIAKAVRKNW